MTLVGGAPLHRDDLITALAHGPTLVAADGGGDTALRLGHLPEAVIGDMDSLSAGGAERLAGRLHEIPEQETTDFDKALRSVEAPLVIAAGVSGGRFDHELAAMNVLVRRADRPCLVLGPESLVFVAPPRLSLDLPVGMAFSLFPFGPCTASAEGLRWRLDGLHFSPGGRVGTSNEVTGPVRLAVSDPWMLVILPRAALGPVVEALAGQGSAGGTPRWSAPGG